MFVLLVFAAVIRLVRLAEPEDLVFDETYYAKDACIYLGYEPDTCGLTARSEQSYVHPPLGKWLIAGGIKVFGHNSFGWRISAVVAGVALVWVAYLLAGRLFKNRWIALVSGLLVATDFLLFVQSRIAMLDIFLALFVTLGFLFVAIDRESASAVKHHLESAGAGPPPVRRPEARLAAGLALGLAMSVKWSAVYALATAALLGFIWSVGIVRERRRIDADDQQGHWPAVTKDALFTCVAFGLVPLLVYLGSYSSWFARVLAQDCSYTVPAASNERVFSAGFYGLVAGECVKGLPGATLNFADLHDQVADYHLQLDAKHPYQSKAWTWPLVLRPVAYFWERETGQSAHILGMGNVVIWGAAVPAGIWLIWRSRRSWSPERVILAAWAAQYLPWLLVRRPLFLFYNMTPTVPFMMIGLAAALNAIRQAGEIPRRLVAAFLVLGVGVMLVIFFPILTAIEIDYDLWRRLMWIPQFDCGGLKCGWI